MKKLTDAEYARILPSIEIARYFAESEDRLQKLEEMNGPRVVIENEKKILAKAREKLKQDPVAGKLLFQVRARVKQEQKRRDAIKATKLGELAELADDFYFSFHQSPDDTLMDKAHKFEELWQILKESLSSEAAFALRTLLADTVTSIADTELPALPTTIEVDELDL